MSKFEVGPFDVDQMRPVLKPDGLVQRLSVTDTFYEDLERHFPDFAGHILIQRFSFEADWPTWEVHPEGDEIVFLLQGSVDFVLWVDGTEQVVRVDEPGSYVVVPAATWHTARPHAPTTMLFFTPGNGTLNATSPG